MPSTKGKETKRKDRKDGEIKKERERKMGRRKETMKDGREGGKDFSRMMALVACGALFQKILSNAAHMSQLPQFLSGLPKSPLYTLDVCASSSPKWTGLQVFLDSIVSFRYRLPKEQE